MANPLAQTATSISGSTYGQTPAIAARASNTRQSQEPYQSPRTTTSFLVMQLLSAGGCHITRVEAQSSSGVRGSLGLGLDNGLKLLTVLAKLVADG